MPRTDHLDAEVLKALIKAGPEGGVAVRYWPVWMKSDQDNFVDTTTRSEPWMLGHGEWVVSLKGKSGGHAVSHCALLPIQGEQGPKYERGV